MARLVTPVMYRLLAPALEEQTVVATADGRAPAHASPALS
jgi:hypothetical protein